MLVSLLLVPLVLGLIQVGLVLHVRNTLTAAATEGARYGANIDRGPADGAARTRAQIDDADRRPVRGGRARARRETVDGVPTVAVTVRRPGAAARTAGDRAVDLSVTGHGVQETAP